MVDTLQDTGPSVLFAPVWSGAKEVRVRNHRPWPSLANRQVIWLSTKACVMAPQRSPLLSHPSGL